MKMKTEFRDCATKLSDEFEDSKKHFSWRGLCSGGSLHSLEEDCEAVWEVLEEMSLRRRGAAFRGHVLGVPPVTVQGHPAGPLPGCDGLHAVWEEE